VTSNYRKDSIQGHVSVFHLSNSGQPALFHQRSTKLQDKIEQLEGLEAVVVGRELR
jgi:hypothetical protein